MKKLIIVCAVVLLLLFLLPSQAKAQYYDTSRFGLKLYGGLNYLSGGEINKAADAYASDWTDLFTSAGYTVTGKFPAANLGMNFGGEFLFMFTPNMGASLGAGYLQASASQALEFSPAVPSDVEYSWKPTLSAIPITATFYYFLPSGGSMKFFFDLGVGYYIAKADFNYYFWFLTPIHGEYKTTGGGLGFHGGLGLEFGLSPMMGIIAELRGRYASFSNFEGTVDAIFPSIPSLNYTVNGKLYAYDSSGKTYVDLDTTIPGGGRAAKVDFSGFSFFIGLIIHF
jgi:hypothetical protein